VHLAVKAVQLTSHAKLCRRGGQGRQGGRWSMIVSHLAGRPTMAIWWRVRGANCVMAGRQQHGDALAFEASEVAISDVTDG